MIATIPMEHVLAAAGALFALGLLGVLVRRNLLFVLMSIEIMLNASALAFVAAAGRFGRPDGQVMFLFILAVAAAESAVGLALAIAMRRTLGTLDTDAARKMRG